MEIAMTTAERWIDHYTRLLAGSLSGKARERAESELAYWQQVLADELAHAPASQKETE